MSGTVLAHANVLHFWKESNAVREFSGKKHDFELSIRSVFWLHWVKMHSLNEFHSHWLIKSSNGRSNCVSQYFGLKRLELSFSFAFTINLISFFLFFFIFSQLLFSIFPIFSHFFLTFFNFPSSISCWED